MKKLILLAGLCCLQPALYAKSFVRSDKNYFKPVDANERAKAHFRANYKEARDASWFMLPDKNMYCMYHERDVVNRVFYDKRGHWKYTIVSYPSSGLDKNIKEMVQDYFPSYQIAYVNEIHSTISDPVYMINIENDDFVKVARVINNEIEVFRSLEKR